MAQELYRKGFLDGFKAGMGAVFAMEKSMQMPTIE
jgi:hypothetical protein